VPTLAHGRTQITLIRLASAGKDNPREAAQLGGYARAL